MIRYLSIPPMLSNTRYYIKSCMDEYIGCVVEASWATYITVSSMVAASAYSYICSYTC